MWEHKTSTDQLFPVILSNNNHSKISISFLFEDDKDNSEYSKKILSTNFSFEIGVNECSVEFMLVADLEREWNVTRPC